MSFKSSAHFLRAASFSLKALAALARASASMPLKVDLNEVCGRSGATPMPPPPPPPPAPLPPPPPLLNCSSMLPLRLDRIFFFFFEDELSCATMDEILERAGTLNWRLGLAADDCFFFGNDFRDASRSC